MSILTRSYVANETSSAARANGFAFYSDLINKARRGAVFLFVDVQRHSAVVFDAIHGTVRAAVSRLDISPTNEIKAQVMLLQKL
jgi:isocitrate dehydrogenase